VTDIDTDSTGLTKVTMRLDEAVIMSPGVSSEAIRCFVNAPMPGQHQQQDHDGAEQLGRALPAGTRLVVALLARDELHL